MCGEESCAVKARIIWQVKSLYRVEKLECTFYSSAFRSAPFAENVIYFVRLWTDPLTFQGIQGLSKTAVSIQDFRD